MSTFDDGGRSTRRSPQGGPSVRTQIIWGGSGFLLGVIVWHFVGFWTFISAIVFRGPDPASSPHAAFSTGSPGPSDRTAALAANQRDRTGSVPTKRSETVLGTAPARDALRQASSDCTALVLDRTAGTTRFASCSADALAHRVVENPQRGDRAPLPDRREAGWSVVVDAGAEAPAVDVSSGNLDVVLDPRMAVQSVRLD